MRGSAESVRSGLCRSMCVVGHHWIMGHVNGIIETLIYVEVVYLY